MGEVLFYHLTESTLYDALPALLERSLQRGWKVVVQAASDERRDALDAHLWTFRDDSFLAHGTDHEPNPAEQPIILTTGQGNPNAATVRFVVDGAVPPSPDDYERLVLMFDGHDQSQVETARQHWKAFKATGSELTYWQQTPEGKWEKTG